jgi:hypothetical protein
VQVQEQEQEQEQEKEQGQKHKQKQGAFTCAAEPPDEVTWSITAASSVSTRSGARARPGDGSTTKGKAGRGRAGLPVEAGVGGTETSRARTAPTSSNHFTTTSLHILKRGVECRGGEEVAR